jgi:hypothetical protein
MPPTPPVFAAPEPASEPLPDEAGDDPDAPVCESAEPGAPPAEPFALLLAAPAFADVSAVFGLAPAAAVLATPEIPCTIIVDHLCLKGDVSLSAGSRASFSIRRTNARYMPWHTAGPCPAYKRAAKPLQRRARTSQISRE